MQLSDTHETGAAVQLPNAMDAIIERSNFTKRDSAKKAEFAAWSEEAANPPICEPNVESASPG